ncbi:MAG: alpha/beta hydrolase, partial [Gammaproteobacteria bacterium]
NPMADIFAMMPEELAQRIILDQESEVAKAMFALPEDMDEKVAVVITQISTLNAAAKFLWPLPDKGLKNRLRRIKAPTTIIWGQQDGLIPVEYAQEFQANIPHMQLESNDQASHTVQLEQLPRCLELTLDFLSANNLVEVA